MSDSKYIIGIDLGTTNSVVAYVETEKEDGIKIFKIPQLVEEGVVENRNILPSFIFLPEEHDASKSGLMIDWLDNASTVVGEFARNRGEELPTRLISSSKSWLCNTLIDGNQPVLPWKGDGDLSKMSPVEASSAVLSHIRSAWNHVMSEGDEHKKIENQEVFLTVPSSFDAVAREFTVQAARNAGLSNITLLEEPQAAFYSWIEDSGDSWRKSLKKNDLVLVCDVGGGTTDYSLIRISEDSGNLALERLSVGNHLLVGGDNMDLALSYFLSQKLAGKGTKIDDWQMRGLSHSCRKAKENIINDSDKSWPVTILGRGSGLIAGVIKEELTSEDIQKIVIDGFFPFCSKDARPATKRRSGIRELGLSYESDPSITKHLAAFLAMNKSADGTVEIPDAVLFNGGIMKSSQVRERILDVLSSWQDTGENKEPVREIYSGDFDLSVAKGAAYFGLAKRGKGVRIKGGLERSYYVAIESSMPAIPGMAAPLKALCLAPKGMEEGSKIKIENEEFVIVTGETVVFDIMGSTCRNDDQTGNLIDEWEDDEIVDVSTIETTLEGDYGKMISVNIEIVVTEIGTVEFWCVSIEDGQRWKLEFGVRDKDGSNG